MIVLAVESSAHTFGIGIFDGKNKKIVANARDVFSTEQGGMIPTKVAEHHIAVKEKVLAQALKEADLEMKDISLISYTQGPGLAPALLVGRDFAVALAEEHKIKLLGVNHIAAHLEIGLFCTKAKDPIFLFCSGANTQVIVHEDKYRIFGEALSIAVGNALDKFAREIGLGFPGGPKVEALAKKGKYVALPYSVKGMDVDFSGIVTRAVQLYKKGVAKEDLCFSLQETCFAMLIEVTERALAHCEKKEVLLIGGVAANKRFAEMLDAMCSQRGAKAYIVPLMYAGDQGAMIAYQGWLERKREQKEFDINPKWRVDEVSTFWK
ncbi:MAG: DNA-binding/iron metalloprotein/AP endonuclease, tRNA threonylcarbamoyladenosine biosynthesis protein [archaeon GW2011_AR17]|nr:MAG: DNA-binding/iron metalloprotein/AP endonuclease, tRNA threonylcarbamoyladenosine biosynthesis protein [archaeon GW2011_AR17]MBS3153876.1 tRNA (adenosine(37)-N6)-threonylcarbamoyltransferase complex transferase subunit TsaD [Candidatus Woesearchaeota archaeon]HIH15477.1 tRNA (adenosine(37)-N6)-threonylcarbamoyltransferase complex transferase subunit TsaD [Nanoarchaeota archaeon]HIH59280.1 tRNA (adenosine(37)-N6)-threonylcarbamoyltransferase complex transferase subunit TsaD [Nanoarchaeota 